MNCRFMQPRFWEHKKSRDRILESGGKERVDFGGTLVSAGGMRKYAGDKMYLCRRNIEI